jgi:hypothetical protein
MKKINCLVIPIILCIAILCQNLQYVKASEDKSNARQSFDLENFVKSMDIQNITEDGNKGNLVIGNGDHQVKLAYDLGNKSFSYSSDIADAQMTQGVKNVAVTSGSLANNVSNGEMENSIFGFSYKRDEKWKWKFSVPGVNGNTEKETFMDSTNKYQIDCFVGALDYYKERTEDNLKEFLKDMIDILIEKKVLDPIKRADEIMYTRIDAAKRINSVIQIYSDKEENYNNWIIAGKLFIELASLIPSITAISAIIQRIFTYAYMITEELLLTNGCFNYFNSIFYVPPFKVYIISKT